MELIGWFTDLMRLMQMIGELVLIRNKRNKEEMEVSFLLVSGMQIMQETPLQMNSNN